MLHDNNVHALTCECLPPSFVLRRPDPSIKYTISLMRLKHQVYRYSHDHEQKARTLWDKGQRTSSVKCVMHAIRCVRFGSQLAERGVVHDLAAANATLATLLAAAPSCASWGAFTATYKAIMDKDMERFESLVNSYKLSPYFLQPHDPLELLTGFLATRPPAALLHELAVQVCYPYPEFPELMQLHLDPVSSPHCFDFTRMCAGTVVDTSNSFRPVCFPFPAFAHHDDDLYSEEKFVPQLDWSHVSVYRKWNALNAYLFPYKGKWLIASYAGLNLYAEGLCVRRKCPLTSITAAVSELFWPLWQERNYTLPPPGDGRQFFFSLSEFTSPPSIALIGVRLADGFSQVPPASVAAELGWPVVDNVGTTIHDAATAALLAEQSCIAEYEGYVVCDPQFRRVSFKSLAYRNLTWATLTPFVPSQDEREARFFMLARQLEFDPARIERFCALAPHLRDWLMAVFTKAKAWLDKVDRLYASVSPTCTQAEFSAAIAQTSQGMKRLLFEVRKDGRYTSPSAFICSPSLYPDAKLARRLYGNIFEE